MIHSTVLCHTKGTHSAVFRFPSHLTPRLPTLNHTTPHFYTIQRVSCNEQALGRKIILPSTLPADNRTRIPFQQPCRRPKCRNFDEKLLGAERQSLAKLPPASLQQPHLERIPATLLALTLELLAGLIPMTTP